MPAENLNQHATVVRVFIVKDVLIKAELKLYFFNSESARQVFFFH